MTTGTVQWFNASKGYGVIKPVDGGFNVFVHISAVAHAGIAELQQGQIVNFEAATDDRTGKIFAENLTVQAIESRVVETSPPMDWAIGFYSQFGWWKM
jgi:cold shock protein